MQQDNSQELASHDNKPDDSVTSPSGDELATPLFDPNDTMSPMFPLTPVETTKEQGSLAEIGDLPFHVKAKDQISKPAADRHQNKGLCLLLVDDNVGLISTSRSMYLKCHSSQQINLQLLVTYSQKRKHRYTTSRDGLQAVQAYIAACIAPALITPSGASGRLWTSAASSGGC